MSLLRREELKTLLEVRKQPSVSIFLPMHRVGAEVQQNPIRLKNLLREAEEGLRMRGLRPADVGELLAPAQSLLDDRVFWQHQSDGLALFLASDVVRSYKLPLTFDELLVVNDHFHLKPLLPLLTGDGRFYILALSQNQVRFFEGTRYRVSELPLPNVPTSRREALKYDQADEQIQFHTGTQAGTGRRAAMFHGHGVGTDEYKEKILEFFHHIDRGLHEWLKAERAPLVLAGVDYLLPIYREANTYRNLVEEGVTGNPDLLRAEELHQQAWAIVDPAFHEAQEEVIGQYQQFAGTGRASTHLQEILVAAWHGRVESLFVAVGVQQWGRFDSEHHTLDLHQEAEPADDDLLDEAAMQTVLHAGTVYTMAPGRVPGDGLLAAVFRY
jgi:hypothetical protein